MNGIEAFLEESLLIEGIRRPPSSRELDASLAFMGLARMNLQAVLDVQSIYTPGCSLRDSAGMDVSVGDHTPPKGGMAVVGALGNLAFRADGGGNPFRLHVEFEALHPFMDGNGRTGRILWAWCMRRTMQDPFSTSFLKRWYFQSLVNLS